MISDAVLHVHLSSWVALAIQLRFWHRWPIVYDCMDDWDGFPGISPALLAAERTLVKTADCTVFTGQLLSEKWSKEARLSRIVRNGADVDYFSRRCVPNTDFSFRHPTIGYYGAIADWVDVELVSELALRHPEWHFVLAGDVFINDLRGLDRQPNVSLLGLLPVREDAVVAASFRRLHHSLQTQRHH